MNVGLLYDYKEWAPVKTYFDWGSMAADLGLDTILWAAKQDSILQSSRVVYAEHEDPYLAYAMKRVMCVPLKTKEEVEYRQAILKDCFRNETFVGRLYQHACTILEKWEKLGRKRNSTGIRDSKAELITDLQVLRLLMSGMTTVKSLLSENIENLHSKGFQSLYARLEEEFSKEQTQRLEKILQDLSFYTDISLREQERNKFYSNLPKIVMECGLSEGLKIGDLRLEDVETVVKPYSNPYGIKAKLQGQVNSLAPGVIALYKDQALQEDAAQLEFEAVSYVYSCCSGVATALGQFYDQLKFQIGFYLGAINLKYQFSRYKLEHCFPMVGEQGSLSFTDLKEVVMSMQQKGKVIGNDGKLGGEELIIITGANQGGKSTFLRSIGIAQVMMQCGLMVVAKRYQSGLYPNFFTHFTRREDSAMNSGRLDAELRRMDQIISNLGERSLLLLNESFATTTEKEGSAIAYDIVKALKEQGVRILTVTHLLSFAQKVYEEQQADAKAWPGTTFLSAQRLEDGTRTFKILPHAPEMTSFGLELYDEVLKTEEERS
ncbi:MAG: hypothetical protein K5678_11255 [Acetatifactor sp.]|nr:hypothetical protein [Acetatifactor sp.]